LPLETSLLVPARAVQLMRQLPLRPAPLRPVQERKATRPVPLALALTPLALRAQLALAVTQPLAEAPLALVLPAPVHGPDGPGMPAPPATLRNSASFARHESRNLGG
jgi:hypothetical protein